MATQTLAISHSSVTNVKTAAGLSVGTRYSIQNIGPVAIAYGEYVDAPDPFVGHFLIPGGYLVHGVEDDLAAMMLAVDQTGKIAITPALD